MKKLKLLDADGLLDCLHVLFYYCLIAGLLTFDPTTIAVMAVIALFSVGLSVFRDDILRVKSQPIDELKAQVDDLQSEVSNLKLHEGIKTLK